ncbi:DNA translocase FtsK [Candidatus Nitronereus thalassa]|uniref:DNA translocase FtsK 4TM domain-containing protein n=1 Tax=Candidatus Nitronereus thalassa TaxID=3020898 RepID=A0ABU3K8B9_9BACT|nr:DNA translocase FtsK 4TM domain-containing protein [Candidatus Nitronereus thalassa]MDT7042641.1 DNA translocase FtsK 4TM domain-containing protein [Candidatus Nitronereus thalassa]
MSTFPRSRGKSIRSEVSSPPFKLSREILGISLFTLGVLVFLSVWSYSPQDPSWLGPLISPSNESNGVSQNVVGMVGATIAAGLVWLVGSAALMIPILIMLQGIRAFQEETLETKARSLIGGILLVLSLSALFEFYGPSAINVIATSITGGAWGQWCMPVLSPLFGETGSTIVLCALILVAVILIAPFSVATALGNILSFLSNLRFQIPRLSFSWLRFPTRGRTPKANKPLKINRSLGMRESALSFLGKKDPLPELDVPEEVLELEVGEPDEIPPVRRTFEMNRKVSEGYNLPDPLALLEPGEVSKSQQTDDILESQSRVLTAAFQNFGISGKVTEVHPGPVITMYEFEPGPGIKVARIVNLAHDLAMALKATRVRIVAPLPGKSTVGIEVPNPVRETVAFREVLTSEAYARSRSKLTMALGKDIFGRPFVADLRTMPHLLVAGATGAGKSVGLNSMLLSLLFSAHPDEVKLLLIDPKVLELQVYDGIPHLLRPALTNPKAAARGLSWVVQEMERRYRLLAEHGVRNVQAYNTKVLDAKANSTTSASTPDLLADQDAELTTEPLPYIVVVIDEFADLMMVAPKEIEEKIARLAQMARASGIHLILATQRPSVDVVTGLIKANFPARIAFQVSSKTDSRTILDSNGAEALLGLGDMLYLAPGTGRLIRLHGSYVSDEDVRRVVEYVKAQAGPDYSDETPFQSAEVLEDDLERDEVYEQAREVVLTSGQASASLLQRRLRVGYPRAARMIEQMEEEGLVSAPGRDGRREILGPQGMIQERAG